MILKTRFLRQIFTTLVLFLCFFGTQPQLKANEAEGSSNENNSNKPFDFKATLSHHLSDAFAWEFGPFGKLDLPRILYHESTGLKFYPSTEAAVEAGWMEAHEVDHNASHGALMTPNAKLMMEEMKMYNVHDLSNAQYKEFSKYAPWDFSITKNVLYMLIASTLIVFIFLRVAAGYKTNHGKAPKGVQSFFEPMLVYLRDEVYKPNIGRGYEKFLPLLYTLFFFIWFLNMLGMTPFSANVTGNIAVTLGLSVVALVVISINGNKHYWGHIVWPPVPLGVKIILIPVEIVGILTKPFALMMRLFANITAGHAMMVALIALIFIVGKNGENVGGGYGTGIITTIFATAISCLEFFVAILQAYVFTMLTSVFIGQAVEDHSHEHAEAHH